MKAKCIKSDPLGFLTVGKVYECKRIVNNVLICGTGHAMSIDNFNEMFEEP